MMNIPTRNVMTASIASAFLMAACASNPPSKYGAVAYLSPASGSTVSGSASFHAIPGGIHLDAAISGLTQGSHGFHVHEVGDCSAPDASSAKGHFNPMSKPHGRHDQSEHHAGDMPNLMADANGNATLSVDLMGLSISDGSTNIMGRAVVIHADPDDYITQPAGNSGKRIACGVIKVS